MPVSNEKIDIEDVLRIHEGTQWMYFTSKPRQEKNLYNALQQQGIPCYLPLVNKTTEYTNRIYTRNVPMFPGYVFASTRSRGFDLTKLNLFLQRCYFLDEYRSAALLRDLITVRKCELLAKENKIEVMTNFRIDDVVTIAHGYFKGEKAVIRRFSSHDEVTVQLTSLEMALTLQLPVDFLSSEE